MVDIKDIAAVAEAAQGIKDLAEKPTFQKAGHVATQLAGLEFIKSDDTHTRE